MGLEEQIDAYADAGEKDGLKRKCFHVVVLCSNEDYENFGDRLKTRVGLAQNSQRDALVVISSSRNPEEITIRERSVTIMARCLPEIDKGIFVSR